MKHSDINHIENTFGIHINNKSFSLTDHSMSINNSNSNTMMMGSVISTQINSNSSTILSTALNTSRPNITKTCSASTPTLNANMMNQLTYISPNNTAIKLINLSKFQQLQNSNKDNSNIVTNTSINVQFVSPVLNNTSNLLNDCTSLSNSVTKIDNSCVSNPSVVLTGASNQTVLTSNNSIMCTRFILHSSQAPILPHGTVTIIPQHSDISGSTMLNSHLIKNTRYALTGTKSTLQAIRPITANTASVVSQSGLISKQSISKVSSSKPINNFTINVSDGNNTIAKQDLTANRHTSISKDQNRNIQKSAPMLTITSSNNIRLALTSSIPNSKVSTNPSKIQLISPKSRNQSGSPVNIIKDGKLKDLSLLGSKDENIENPACYNLQKGCHSPTRKRARKQHLKVVTNKLQKLASHSKFETCSINNNIRHTSTDKALPTPISIAPTTTKFACITTQNKVVDSNTSSTTTPVNNIPQIIIPLKNPIHICTSKVQTLASIYTGHLNSTNGILNSTKTIGNGVNQVQIITQSSQSRPVHFSSISQSLILSQTFDKNLSNISPQKMIHIAPTKISNNYIQAVKNEKISSDSLNSVSVVKEVVNQRKHNDNKEAMKLENSEIKSEDFNIKYSLFPQKYHWNARRSHFEKESDVKIKKTKMSSSFKQLNPEDNDEVESLSDTDTISDTSWCLYKASTQFLMQKCFDEENLRNFHKLKRKFDFNRTEKSDNDEPVFQKVCLHSQQFDQLPDQIDVKSFSEYTDPRLFGISDDILDNSINVITIHNQTMQSQDRTTPHICHQCSESCIFYSSEVPTLTPPSHILRILDLIEGLIVKEKKIIEKESEINDQCLRLLESSEGSPLIINKNQNRIPRVKTQNGRRW